MPAAATLTYDTLTSDVKSYLERPSDAALAAQLPRLIMLAENRLATALKILGVQQIGQGTLTAGSPTMAKPSLWRQTVSFRVQYQGDWKDIYLRTYEFCRQYWPNPSATVSVPRYYADYNFDQFLLVGTPATALAFELVYIAKLEPLSSSNQANWYTANAPQLLLAAVLLESEIWLKNQTRIAARQEAYQSALDAFKAQDGGRAFDRNVVVA